MYQIKYCSLKILVMRYRLKVTFRRYFSSPQSRRGHSPSDLEQKLKVKTASQQEALISRCSR